MPESIHTMKSNIGIIAIIAISLLSYSCVTYHLTTQSLVEQCIDAEPQRKHTAIVVYPIILPFTVTGNDLTELKVLDPQEKEYVLPITNRTGVRITMKDGKRTTFYVNTLILKDSTITGKKDHFIGMNIRPIPLSKIAKIELQK